MPEAFLNAYWSLNHLVLLRRDEAGTLLERRVPAEHVLFIKTTDYLTIETECQVQLTKRRFRQVKVEGEFTRLSCDSPDFRYWLVSTYFKGKSISTYEADLHPVKRFLIDSECAIQKPICAAFDLETDDRFGFKDLGKGRILCWSICKWNGEQVKGVLEEDTDEAEREMLLDFFYELENVDCLLAWNGDRFDFPYLKERIKALKLNVELRRWLLLDHMQAFKKYNMHSAESGDEKDSVALERVAASLGINVSDKLEALDEIGKLRTWELWEAGGHKRDLLSKRNVFDSWSMYRIEQLTKYVDLHYAVCQTSGVFPDSKALSAKNTVEGFLMRLAARKQLRFPTMYQNDEAEKKFEKFRGAFVMEIEPGIKRNVHVCDFAGMYPANIQSWNMSPETLRPELAGKEGETLEQVVARLPAGHCVSPNTLQVFANEPVGILSQAVAELKKMRKTYNKIKDAAVPGSDEWNDADKLSQGAKITVNSCFGVVSSPFSRLFVKEVGESITLSGQWLIRETMKFGENKYGIRPVAGDTDSTFAVGVGALTFSEFVKDCNSYLYPKLLKELGCVRNEVVLEYEKELDLMVSVAKKRYAGRYKTFKGKPAKEDAKPVIKGFEYKRGDSIRIARKFQEEVVRKLLLIGQPIPDVYPLKPTDFHETIERWRKHVLEEDLTVRDLIISKSLSKEVAEYDGNDVHVRIARILEQRGETVTEGSRIEYIVTGGQSPIQAIPVADYQKGCEDREYYWLNMVYPCVQRILEACWPEHRWDRFSEVPGRGGGKGKSKYGPGQTHLPWFWD